MSNQIVDYQDFQKLDIRVGKIIEVEDFPEAINPSYKLLIDFGVDFGKRKSSAQLTKYYQKDDLIGKTILCLVNVPSKQIGPFISQVLTLGVPDEEGQCVLISPDSEKAVLGGKLF